MNRITSETPEELRFKKFMHTFNGYLIAQVISREYDMPGRLGRVRTIEKIAEKIRRMRNNAIAQSADRNVADD